MTSKKIQELADYFYSSDEVGDVPLRISIITGGFSGFDLSRESFSKLMEILNKSKNIKEDLIGFVQEYGG